MIRSGALLALALFGWTLPAAAQSFPPGCSEVCSATCVKPWSLPDRWDDSGRPGWPAWTSNGRWDCEAFTDLDGDRLWDPGEPFQDGRDTQGATGPQDGAYTAELYDPSLTGYTAGADAGRLMTLKTPVTTGPGYYPLALPIPGGPSGRDAYRWNIAACNPGDVAGGDLVAVEPATVTGITYQGVSELIAQDPAAYWDAARACVAGSAFAVSPRLVVLPAHDPRRPLASGDLTVSVVKLVGFFLENVTASGELTGRLAVTRAASGEPCAGPGAGGFLYDCALVARPLDWGRLKATYR